MAWDLKEPECITQARLMSASPEFIYEQLVYYGKTVDHWSGKENLEKTLLTRNDNLINLALAQHATRKEVILDLYNRASQAASNTDEETYNLGVRVACLSNQHFDYFNWPDFDLNALMAKGFTVEAHALLTNPTAPETLLASLYKKSDCFAQVEESDWLTMVAVSARNERLNTDESTESGPDMGLWDIHKAIFHFLETAPVTPRSVRTTGELLNTLEPRHCAWPDEIWHVIDRWRNADVKNHKGEPAKGWSTDLPLNEELACLIGALYCHRSTTQKDKPRLFGTADNKDIALRCAYYGGAQMSEKETAAGYDKDKDVFLLAALKNTSLYRNKNTRALLEDYITGFFCHEYKRRCEQIHKQYTWFDPRPITEVGRGAVEDLTPQPSAETTLLENIKQQNAVLIDRVASYERHLSWATIIVIGVMYYLLKG